MVITYNDEGILMPDSKAYETMKALCEKGEDFAISSEASLYALRVLVLEGVVPYETTVVRYKEETIKLNENGKFSHHPDGFFDIIDGFLDTLLHAQFSKIERHGTGIGLPTNLNLKGSKTLERLVKVQ
ncbi:hypothetical protein [Rossellomorea marisflavi]|uniref:hypothetical protein n=1 Tax=Rossellomorea marisflavi TaxID=189381 RepID=UPI003FA13A37